MTLPSSNNRDKKFYVRESVILETVTFLKKQGQRGLEGRVYWIGTVNGNAIHVDRIAIPRQTAVRTALGVSVTVTPDDNLAVQRSLKSGEYVAIKVHSHPNRAYMSQTDKDNPFLRHEGAVSVVVPAFGRTGMDKLQNCCVAKFEQRTWRELTKEQAQRLFVFN